MKLYGVGPNPLHLPRCPRPSIPAWRRQLQQAAPVARPAIVGVAHIGLKTDDLAAARKFYTGVLGFQEPFTLDKAPGDGTGLLLTYFKVNDHQYIEVFSRAYRSQDGPAVPYIF